MKSFIPRQIAAVVAAVLVTALIGSCSDDGGTKPKPPDDDPRTVVDEVSGTVTDAGGTLTLQNGMMLSIPAGAVSGSVDIDLVQYTGDTNFTSDHQTVLEITASGPVSGGVLAIPLAPDQDTSLVGAAFLPDGATLVEYLDCVFCDALDTMYVTLTGSSGFAAGVQATSGSYVIARGTTYVPVIGTGVMELPYYQQDGDNCWAACMLMLAKSQKSTFVNDEIYELLHLMNVGKADGLAWYDMGSVKSRCASMTGFTAQKNTWIVFRNFLQHVVKCMEEKRPVMVNLITHQAVICGFEIENPGPNEVTYLIMHDPANWLQQKPYMKITLDDLAEKYWNQGTVGRLVNYFVTVDFLMSKLPNPNLETVHLPDADDASNSIASFSKGLAFGKGIHVADRVIWDHTKSDGYAFEHPGGIPADIDLIKLAKAPVWNTDREDPRSVTIRTRLYRMIDGVYKLPPLVERTNEQTLAPVSSYDLNVEISVDEFIDYVIPADSMFGLEVALFNSDNQQVDDFDVVFKYKPLRITSISPDIGEPDEEIRIWGLGFGKSQGSSKVKFNGVEADVVSWDVDEIEAKVPPTASSGKITVEVNGAVSNGMDFTVIGGVLDLLHETVAVLIQVSALHTYGLNGFQTTYGMATQGDTLQWNGTSFEINKVIDGSTIVNFSGTVSQDGRVVEHIDAYYYSPGVITNTFNVVLDSIPLASWYTPQENVFYELPVNSTTYSRHATTMISSRVREDGSDFQTYLYTDWGSTTTPPVLRITFIKNP